jgi:hypothetical protein
LGVTEAEATLLILPAPWFGFGGGLIRRTETTKLATQRWDIPKVTAVSRLTFVGGAITSVVGVSMLPGATYSGYKAPDGVTDVKPNPLSLAGEAGLELRASVFNAALMYYVEKITFPAQNGITRQDQFSTLRLKFGLQAGR